MSNAGDFTRFDDDALSVIVTWLDLESLLRLARACKRFWTLIFESHTSVIWRRIALPLNCLKYIPIVHLVSDLIESFSFPTDHPSGGIGAHEILRHLPTTMKKLKHLSLQMEGEFEMDLEAVAGLAAKCPALVSISAPQGRWHYDTLGIARQAFPRLSELQIKEFCISDHGSALSVTTQHLDDILNTLKDLNKLEVHSLYLRCTPEPGLGNPVDLLAVSKMAKTLDSLTIFLGDFGSQSPNSSLEAFKSLYQLTLVRAGARHGNWLLAALQSVTENLRCLSLRDCQGLGAVWAKLQHFPRGLYSLDLLGCSDLNANLERLIIEHAALEHGESTVLVDLAICATLQHPMEFCVSEMVKRLADLEYLKLKGPVSNEHNSIHELTHVYNYLMALEEMKKLLMKKLR